MIHLIHVSLVVLTHPSSMHSLQPCKRKKRSRSVTCQCDLESGCWEGLCYILPNTGLKKEPVFQLSLWHLNTHRATDPSDALCYGEGN